MKIDLFSNNQKIRVNIPPWSFNKFLSKTKINDTALQSLANALEGIKIPQKNETTGFASTSEFHGIEYVGYIIDKERLDRATKTWKRIDEYRIIGRLSESFIDTRIVYGEMYRYRIKSILRITRKKIIYESVPSDVIDSINKIFQNKVQEALEKNSELFNNPEAFFNLGLNSKNNNQPYEINLFENFYAQFDGNSIKVIQKTNYNKDIQSKNSKLINVSVLGNNYQISLPTDIIPSKIKKESYESFYYESWPSKKWIYVDVFEEVPPPPPETILIHPNSLSKKIMISWLRPANEARDIKKYRVYRREKLGDKWSLIYETLEVDVNDDGLSDSNVILNNASNYFEDTNVEFNKKYIYALTCVSIHNSESFLSTQIQAELNDKFAFELEERSLKWVSGAGARLSEVDFIYKKFLTNNENVIAKRSIKLTTNTKFSEAKKDFIVRITSLDTHQKQEFKLTLINENTTTRQQEAALKLGL